MNIKDQYLELALAGEVPLIFDGGFGTMVQMMHLDTTGTVGDVLNFTQPAAVTAIHQAYVDAGAQCILTSTFNSNRFGVAKYPGMRSVREMYAAAVENVRAANPEYVVGDIGPCGRLLEPYGDATEDELYDCFAEQVDAACKAGVDLIMVETMLCLEEAELAVRAAADFGNVPVVASMSFEASGKTMYGNTPAQAANVLTTVGASIVGANCSVGPDDLIAVAKEYVQNSFVPVLIKPNAGLPVKVGDEFVYNITPSQFAESMRKIVAQGVTCVGGCCGTTPDFIAAVSAMF